MNNPLTCEETVACTRIYIISRGRASANAFGTNKQTCPDEKDNKWEFTTGNGWEDARYIRLNCISEGKIYVPHMIGPLKPQAIPK